MNDITDNLDADIYVDTKEMLDTFSKDIIYMKMPPPYTQTLFVELMRFTPGQPDSMTGGNGIGSSRSMASSSSIGLPPYGMPLPHPRAGLPPPPSHHHAPPIAPRPPSPMMPYDQGRPRSRGGSVHVPPPPPWSSRSSRWSNAAATAPPPTSRSHTQDGNSPIESPGGQSRKRKHSGDVSPIGSSEGLPIQIPSPTVQPSPKRRSTLQTPPMHTSPMHTPTMHTPLQTSAMHASPVHPQAGMHAPVIHPAMMHGPPIHPAPPGLHTSNMHPGIPHPSSMPHPPVVPPGYVHPIQPSPVHGPPMPQAIHIAPMPPLVHPHPPMQPLRTPPMPPSQAANSRTSQGLSPSLALMLSPNPGDVATSPQRQGGPPYLARVNSGPQPAPGSSRPAAEETQLPPVRPKDSFTNNPRSTEDGEFRWDTVLTSVFQPHNYSHLRSADGRLVFSDSR